MTQPESERAGSDRAKALLESPDFRKLVAERWRVSLTLTAALFLLYYGYVLLIALNKPLLARRVGDVVTLGIPVGVAVILGAWVLTASYVIWANRRYDTAVRDLRERLHR